MRSRLVSGVEGQEASLRRFHPFGPLCTDVTPTEYRGCDTYCSRELVVGAQLIGGTTQQATTKTYQIPRLAATPFLKL